MRTCKYCGGSFSTRDLRAHTFECRVDAIVRAVLAKEKA